MERKFDMQNGSNFGTKSVTNKAITNIHFSVGLAMVLPVETHSNANTKNIPECLSNNFEN